MGIVFGFVIWAVIWLGDMPAGIAKNRNHPQVSAITALSWFGLLFTGGILWIVAMVWAYFDYSAAGKSAPGAAVEADIDSLRERLGELEAKLSQAEEAS
jgi:hypothetical protein